MIKIEDPYKLAVSIVLPLAISFAGAFFTASGVGTWYDALNKPFFNPPTWIFSPVWTILYFAMGIALYLVWKKKSVLQAAALTLFGIQLLLNLLWSIIFFRLHQIGWAFVEIIFLWAAILATGIVFYKISKRAGYLFIPYLAWVTFAALLNLGFYLLN